MMLPHHCGVGIHRVVRHLMFRTLRTMVVVVRVRYRSGFL
jgi:hypothetical protein